MNNEKEIRNRFWRGVILGPLAIFPAVFIYELFFMPIFTFSIQLFLPTIFATFFIGLWGAAIAYIAIAIYGSLAWYILKRIRKNTLLPILAASIIPALVSMLLFKDLKSSLLIAYYSLAVAFTVWFIGLRNIKKL